MAARQPAGRSGAGDIRRQVRRQAEELARRRRNTAGRAGWEDVTLRGRPVPGRPGGRMGKPPAIRPRKLARILPDTAKYADKPGAIARSYARRDRRAERRYARQGFRNDTVPEDTFGPPVRKAALRNRAPARRRV